MAGTEPVLLDSLEPLVAALRAGSRRVIAPTVRDGAVVLAEIEAAADLPHGWGVTLAAGRYRLDRRSDRAAFGHAAGPQSWKTWLRPPRTPLWSARRTSDGTVTVTEPAWDDVARRCLSGGNCTMVCPTCFCTTVEDTTDLDGSTAHRDVRWDSCFDLDFSYLHGGPVRSSSRSRYRQWLTHKLGTWHDQFGDSGCVGCGRCVVWCPAGIDITAEMAALAAGPTSRGDAP